MPRKASSAPSKKRRVSTKPKPVRPKLADIAEKARDATEQTGSILKKVMELTDASIGLGINVVSMLTSMAQAQFGGSKPAPEETYAAPADAPAEPPAPDGRAAPAQYGIFNRVPISPGGQVRVPFAINNDLPRSPKSLVVSAHGFAGATRGFQLDDAAFSVEPSEKVIAPLDFEKFLLVGVVPEDAPEDTYNGWILVGGDEKMKIPAVLAITKPR